jgi:hypothetical protein
LSESTAGRTEESRVSFDIQSFGMGWAQNTLDGSVCRTDARNGIRKFGQDKVENLVQNHQRLTARFPLRWGQRSARRPFGIVFFALRLTNADTNEHLHSF